eukprot:363366-Chlamydomonas_euryale.AAC.12
MQDGQARLGESDFKRERRRGQITHSTSQLRGSADAALRPPHRPSTASGASRCASGAGPRDAAAGGVGDAVAHERGRSWKRAAQK